MKDKHMASSLSIVVLLNANGGGDWPPLVALATGLQARGHSVCLVCDASTAAAAGSTGLAMVCVPLAFELSAYLYPRVQQLQASGEELGLGIPSPFVEWAQACAPAVRAAIQERQPAVLISSLVCMGLADLLAAELRVPWCFVNPAFYFGEDSARPWDVDFHGVVARMFRDWFLPLSQRATLVLHATDPCFDFPPAHLPGHHHYVGPLLWEVPTDAPAFLNAPGPPWVLVTLSTVPQAGEMVIARAAIRALEREAVRVLVTLAPGHARAELGEVPAHIHINGYIPHGTVLQKSRLVISHAGHGIVMKALYHGVPMVLVPWERDQPGVAARAEALGVATVVRRDDCDEVSVDQAVHRILEEPCYTEKVHAISRRLQVEDAVTLACSHVESLVGSTA
jgi:UDP:flavonoid glycosyltransferase YjiC (YdhE family)